MELKRCPFCGGEAGLAFHRATSDYSYWVVQCQQYPCDIEGPCAPDEESAVVAWNNRAHAKHALTLQTELFRTAVALEVSNSISEKATDELREVVNMAKENADALERLQVMKATETEGRGIIMKVQPMGTAPKDRQIIGFEEGNPVVMYWFQPPEGEGFWVEYSRDAFVVHPDCWIEFPDIEL